MAIHAFRQGQTRRGQEIQLRTRNISAPIRGIDSRIATTLEAPYHCAYCFNLVPSEFGMQVRSGYREWQIGLDDGNPGAVRTIIPFDGIEDAGADDRLFAATPEGIWDVTVQDGTPVLKVAFADITGEAGYGVYAHYVDNAGANSLFFADSKNGLFAYDPVADTWAQAAGITGPTVTDIRFVVLHKQRLWLIEENDTKAWYLPVGSASGAATEFFFGSKFRHGGSLEGIFSWSVDGGAGLDDLFVAVSHAGDVLVYEGDDPSSAATWSSRGVYYIGELPQGPFFGAEHGGELYLLSAQGLIGMSDLLRGVNALENATDTISQKITSLIRITLARTAGMNGWHVRNVPSLGGLLIQTPAVPGLPPIQFFYNFAAQGWGFWRDVPMTAFDSWNGSIAFGDGDGRILYMNTTRDEVELEAPEDQLRGKPIKYSVLTSFSRYDEPGRFKQVKIIRPDFITRGKPEFRAEARYDYNVDEIVSGITPAVQDYAVWDLDAWDAGLWAPGRVDGANRAGGAVGSGRAVAIAMVGYASEETRFVGWDVVYTLGGPMN